MERRDGEELIQREIGIDMSASDGARLKWAYYLAWSWVGFFRLIIRDWSSLMSPDRQQMKIPDLGTFLKRAAIASSNNRQVIVATSQTREFVDGALAGAPKSCIQAFEGFLLQPDQPQ